jgi:uncharacterized protein YkwD
MPSKLRAADVVRGAQLLTLAILAACSSSPGESVGPGGDRDGATAAGDHDASTGADDGGPTPVGEDGGTGGATGDATAGHDAATADATASSDGGGATDASVSDGATGGVYPPAAGQGTIDDGVAQLNRFRALAGLNAVTLDPVSSQACAAHLAYLVCAAATMGNGYLEHTETGVPSCAQDGGEPAGQDSDIAWGQGRSGGQTTGQSFGQAVDLWINGLYHRTPLLDPGLTRVGAASSMGYNCLDYAAAGNRTTVRAAAPVLFPPDGTTNVPLEFGGNEGPCPTMPANPQTATSCPTSGFIPSANWYGWSTGNKSAISGTPTVSLTDNQTQAAVPLLAWYADTVTGHDPAPGFVRNEIALVPQANLAANHSFTVNINATISGQATNLSWSFTTGTRTQ